MNEQDNGLWQSKSKMGMGEDITPIASIYKINIPNAIAQVSIYVKVSWIPFHVFSYAHTFRLEPMHK